MRRLLLPATLIAALAAVPSAAPAAVDAKTLRCASADLRYGIQEGMPHFFGVHRLKVTDGTCATAHRVAKRWQRRFERSPTATLPRKVYGFRFRQLPPNAAQTYRLKGTRGTTVVRFAYVVPNG
jgi:hypothetical protein